MREFSAGSFSLSSNYVIGVPNNLFAQLTAQVNLMPRYALVEVHSEIGLHRQKLKVSILAYTKNRKHALT